VLLHGLMSQEIACEVSVSLSPSDRRVGVGGVIVGVFEPLIGVPHCSFSCPVAEHSVEPMDLEAVPKAHYAAIFCGFA
jgi:hypothetical protein